MAKKTAEDDSLQGQSESYRGVLASAYAYVEAQKSVQTLSAISPEELYDRFVERISGPDTQARPNVLNRIAKIRNEIIAATEKIKALPPEAFRIPDFTKDVNTPVDIPEE
jgi:hypothetical protein